MPQSAIDLKVWKELAINKQLLIKTATDALGLDPECKEDELKDALEQGIKRITEAQSMVSSAKKESEAAISEIQTRLDTSEQTRLTQEVTISELTDAKQALENLLETTRNTNAKEVKKTLASLEEKTKALKAINVALADTPENVVKKLKALNKKKFDESTARKRAEEEVRSLKKEKQELKSKLETGAEQSKNLAEKYRELHELGQNQYMQLKPLVDEEETLTPVPELDDELLESIDKSA